MTKSQLIETVAASLPHIQKRDVETAVNALFSGMVDAMKRDERIEIRGFGAFSIRRRDAREGRNPKTGQRVVVPTRRSPAFAAGKELRARINAEQAAPDEEAA